MCDRNVCQWFSSELKNKPQQFKGKHILEVGSKAVNGSIRTSFDTYKQQYGFTYLGADIASGPCVDVIVPAEQLVQRFGKNAFDIVITTEMMEHVYDWQTVINNIKQVLKPNGVLYLTTRSIGFHYHAYPFDFWRYQPEDLQEIFSDFHIKQLHYDSETIGVWLKAKKPQNWEPRRTELYLYSMAAGKRVASPQYLTLPRRMLVLLTRLIGRFSRQTQSSLTQSTAKERTVFSRVMNIIRFKLLL